MTNEELASMAQKGNQNALHALYMQNKGLLALLFKRLIASGRERMTAAGVTEDDAIQCGYFVLLDAVKAYDPAQGLKFTAYLKYPVINQWNVLIGYRTQKQRREPLNIAASLDEPITDGEGNQTARVETVECTAATQAFQAAEDGLYTQQLHDDLEDLLGKLTPEQETVIRAHYYQRQTVTEIGEQLGVKPHHVRHAEYMGLRDMRRHRSKLEPYREQIISKHSLRGTGFQSWKYNGSVPERITEMLDKRTIVLDNKRTIVL